MIPQSNVIFAFLFIGFLVWITVRGELPTYLNYLLQGAASQQAAQAGQQASAQQSAATAPSNDNEASGINPELGQVASSLGSVASLAALA